MTGISTRPVPQADLDDAQHALALASSSAQDDRLRAAAKHARRAADAFERLANARDRAEMDRGAA
ncbi:hypothetical protein SAMN05444722_1715 [Rhodovulum sp. ES.010]|uniref:hypothetical protein n=1 Tax=Rhodovulum sp. ES.010 TaxID=1882821 RepID=UPI000926108E|nr:hypothetical protein [Rhodovulum sp. ES.010]SIO36956.1 hypothetical protein SAMN05444722_1715 [Rhodovulum sp. ES.010]